jgi:DNA-binding NarL/FixJ family response regulator
MLLLLALRVLVVGEDPLARAALAQALRGQEGLRVAGESAGGAALQRALLLETPDLLLHDLGPQPDAGARLTAAPGAGVPRVAVASGSEAASRALRAGARGVVFRDGDGARSAAALRAVAAGHYVLDEAFAEEVLAPTRESRNGSAQVPEADGAPAPSRLAEDAPTPREQDVLDLLAEGLSNKEIGTRLGIGERTARFHVAALLRKLGARSRTDVVVRAARRGLLRI